MINSNDKLWSSQTYLNTFDIVIAGINYMNIKANI